MKISRVETVPVDRYLFVQVHTDEGVVGLGEVGTWGFLEAADFLVEESLDREPYEFEYQSRRAYILARKPK